MITKHPDTWMELSQLGAPAPYRKVFDYDGDRVDSFHSVLSSAALGRMGVDCVIDLGIDGYLQREDAMLLYEICRLGSGDVLQLGTYKGLSTYIISRALKARGFGCLTTVDIDAATTAEARATVGALIPNNDVEFIVADAPAHLDRLIEDGRKFGVLFVDHWHGYEATHDATSRAASLLDDGGLVLFHDFLDPGNADPKHPYGVYQAVCDTVGQDPRFQFVTTCGCCAMYQFQGSSGLVYPS